MLPADPNKLTSSRNGFSYDSDTRGSVPEESGHAIRVGEAAPIQDAAEARVVLE
jgi:hypothetical protein